MTGEDPKNFPFLSSYAAFSFFFSSTRSQSGIHAPAGFENALELELRLRLRSSRLDPPLSRRGNQQKPRSNSEPVLGGGGLQTPRGTASAVWGRLVLVQNPPMMPLCAFFSSLGALPGLTCHRCTHHRAESGAPAFRWGAEKKGARQLDTIDGPGFGFWGCHV